VLHYQPKVDAHTAQILGVEALVRWQHPEHGLLSPGDFIPPAERTGIIGPLTYYVLDAALRQCRAWQQAGHELSMAVNVSARSLLDLAFPDQVASLLARWELPARLLVLEITESTIMADPTHALVVLSRLDAMGVQVSIDDFGTGYSSMAHLKSLPVHEAVDRRSNCRGCAARRPRSALLGELTRPSGSREPPLCVIACRAPARYCHST
jgi:diguanylate cyclase